MDAYFDIFSGISGNMVLGALIDLGVEVDELKKEINKLGISEEYELKVNTVQKSGITGTYVDVELEEHHHHSEDDDHSHTHGHSHGRGLKEIIELLDKSDLSAEIKEKSKLIFTNLAEAEAGIHNKDVNEIHFHEVGAVDAIVDIVGSVIGLDILGIENIYASRINTGNGFVKCEHGIIPVPAPATMELLKNIPIYSSGIEKELVTPTGAAIITTLADEYGSRPDMKIKKTGYGAGSYDLEIPNLLRINLGNIKSQKKKMQLS